ncbi:tripartite tricarboxylate transporter TctB family protein [Bosea caraganae]|nr:tripartite tricarboxylate transporter TctB family protein [Bosea caraganae]
MRTTGRQLKAGGIFVAIGAFFLATALLTLDIGSTLRMGAGFMPVLLSCLLIALGIGVVLERAGEDEVEARPIPWRGLAFITLAPLLFALTVKGLGLAPALLGLIATSSLASRMMSLTQVLIVTAVLLAISLLVFSYVLGLPYPLFALSAG